MLDFDIIQSSRIREALLTGDGKPPCSVATAAFNASGAHWLPHVMLQNHK